MAYSSVADLSVDELRQVIKEVVIQTILEMFDDPDEGLELRDEIQERLQRSLAATLANVQTRSAQDVATKLGLEW